MAFNFINSVFVQKVTESSADAVYTEPVLNASSIHANCILFTCKLSASAKLPGGEHSWLLISH